jgi:hypothetical protein
MASRMPAELRTTRAKNDLEEQLQRSIVERLRWQADPRVIFFHVPNGGARSKSEGAKFKALGVLPGVPDLIFLLPDATIFCMELKSRDGVQSDGQKAFQAKCEAIGVEYTVCHDIDTAVSILTALGVLPA